MGKAGHLGKVGMLSSSGAPQHLDITYYGPVLDRAHDPPRHSPSDTYRYHKQKARDLERLLFDELLVRVASRAAGFQGWLNNEANSNKRLPDTEAFSRPQIDKNKWHEIWVKEAHWLWFQPRPQGYLAATKQMIIKGLP